MQLLIEIPGVFFQLVCLKMVDIFVQGATCCLWGFIWNFTSHTLILTQTAPHVRTSGNK